MKRVFCLFVSVLWLLAAVPVPAEDAKIHLIELDSPPVVRGVCPATVRFHGYIETTGRMAVSFDWVRSDGVRTSRTLHFAKAGRRNVFDSWTVSKTYSGWEQIVVTSPNQLETRRSTFQVNCVTRKRQ